MPSPQVIGTAATPVRAIKHRPKKRMRKRSWKMPLLLWLLACRSRSSSCLFCSALRRWWWRTTLSSSPAAVSTAEANLRSAVFWPAIFAGAAVAVGTSLVLLALGSGLGFAAASPGPAPGRRLLHSRWRGYLTNRRAVALIGASCYIAGRLRCAGRACTATKCIPRYSAWAPSAGGIDDHRGHRGTGSGRVGHWCGYKRGCFGSAMRPT